MSAIRALRQVSTPFITRRTFCTVPRVGGMRIASLQSSKTTTTVTMRGFATSSARFGQGSADVTLSQKLQEELNYEKETAGTSDDVPQFLKEFREQGVWAVEEVAGQDEVTLTRKFGNENLRLIFSIADLTPAEDEFTDEDNAETEEEESRQTYPVRASLSITKTNAPGALTFDMMVQDGTFMVDNISYYDEAKLGTELTAEADWKRRGLYIGPQFDTLDVAVQDEFEQFLRERGVNEAVAGFIPQFAELKEQKEYVKWLNKVKSFVDV